MTGTPILATGGAGFIGSHTCKQLSREGFLPIAYDNLSTGNREAVKWGPLDAVERATGRRVPAVMRPARAGDPPSLYADGRLAREVLGFTPEVSDIDTIMRTAAPSFAVEVRHVG